MNISTFSNLYWLKILQNAKCLESFHQPFIYAKKDHIIQYFRKLPKKIKNIELRLYKTGEWTRQDLFPLYKSLALLKDLEVFRRYFSSDAILVESAVMSEYQLIRQYTSRLKKLKEFDYEQTFYDQIGIHKIMKGNVIYPQITSLTHISSFQRSESFFDGLNSEESDDMDSNETLKISQKRHYVMNSLENFTVANKENRLQNGQTTKRVLSLDQQYKNLLDQEIIPLYSFYIFPNLTNLSFLITHNCLYPLGDFVIQGFKHLKNLQKFNLVLNTRPHGTVYLFKAISCLPILNTFSLEITFIEGEEWKLLEEFFQRQQGLISLSLSVSRQRSTKAGYIQQNKYIETYLWRYLKNKPKLKFLKLKSTSWSLESLSNSLEKVPAGMMNQLQCLEIEGLDDTITSTKDAQRRIKGLCEFLKRQKETLKHFRLDLPLIFEVEVFNYLAETIAQLSHLKDLEIYMSNGDLSIDYFLIYFQEVILVSRSTRPQKRIKVPKTWDLKVAKMLQELENLESFTFDFGIVEDISGKPSKWLGDLFKTSCFSRKLSSLTLRAPSTISYDMVERIEAVLMQLKRLRSVMIDVEGDDYVKQRLEAVLEGICERQAMKFDLMF